MTAVSGYVVALMCFMVFRHLLQDPATRLFMKGLNVYLAKGGPALPSIPPEEKSSKKEKKELQKKILQLKDAADTVYSQSLQPLWVKALTFSEDFEMLGIFLFMLALIFVGQIAVSALFGVQQTFMLTIFCLAGALCGMYALTRTELSADYKHFMDKAHLIVLGLLGAVLCFGVLALAPDDWIDFRLQAAAADLDKALNVFVTKLHKRMKQEQVHTVRTDPLALACGLSIWGGTMTAMLWAAGSRFARLLHQATEKYTFAVQQMTHSWLAVRAMQLSFILPLSLAISHIKPMTSFWGLDERILSIARPSIMAAYLACSLGALRPLLQAFLNTALLEFHAMRHDGKENVHKAIIIGRNLNYLLALLCKVGVQLLAVPVILASCLILLLLYDGPMHQLLPSAFATSASNSQAASTQAPEFFAFLGNFMSFWTCFWWSLYAYFMMFVFRLGMHIG